MFGDGPFGVVVSGDETGVGLQQPPDSRGGGLVTCVVGGGAEVVGGPGCGDGESLGEVPLRARVVSVGDQHEFEVVVGGGVQPPGQGVGGQVVGAVEDDAAAWWGFPGSAVQAVGDRFPVDQVALVGLLFG